MRFNPTQVFKLREEHLFARETDGETIVLDASSHQYLAVNASGQALWEALAVGASKTRLVEVLVATYGIDRLDADRDVDTFLAALSDRGLLEPVS